MWLEWQPKTALLATEGDYTTRVNEVGKNSREGRCTICSTRPDRREWLDSLAKVGEVAGEGRFW